MKIFGKGKLNYVDQILRSSSEISLVKIFEKRKSNFL
jgi:hypothetical protein